MIQSSENFCSYLLILDICQHQFSNIVQKIVLSQNIKLQTKRFNDFFFSIFLLYFPTKMPIQPERYSCGVNSKVFVCVFFSFFVYIIHIQVSMDDILMYRRTWFHNSPSDHTSITTSPEVNLFSVGVVGKHYQATTKE